MHIGLRFLTFVTTAALTCSCAALLGAQEPSSVPEKVRKYRLAHENEIVREFTRLLSIPNLASDMPNIERNAEAITKGAGEPRRQRTALTGPRSAGNRLRPPKCSGCPPHHRNLCSLRRFGFTAMAKPPIHSSASGHSGADR
jgi:hypothetical protein